MFCVTKAHQFVSTTGSNIDSAPVNRRRVVVNNAVGDNPLFTVRPDLNSYAIMKVCRVCLAKNVKMYIISDHKLNVMYERVTGVQINTDDKLPQMLCWECVARLSSANKFIKKALKSHWIMSKKISGDKLVTMCDIESIDKAKYQFESTLGFKFYKVNYSNLHIRESSSCDGNENTDETIDDDDEKERIFDEEFTVKREYMNDVEEQEETGNCDVRLCEEARPVISSIKENFIDNEESNVSGMSGEENTIADKGEDDVVKKEKRKRKNSRVTTLSNRSAPRLKKSKLVEDVMLNLRKKNNQDSFKNLTNNDQSTNNTDTDYLVQIETGSIFVETVAVEETIKTEKLPDPDNTSESDCIRTDTLNNYGESPKNGLICDICNKSFVHKSSLNRHIKEHTNVFNCTYCSYQTNMKSNFARHVNSKHTHNTVFTCSNCDYKSYTKTCLNKHIAKHTKEGNDKTNLDKHVKTTAFNCLFCSYSTYRKGNLTEHINAKHTKNLVFNCTYCDYKTYNKSYLKRHVNVKHTKDTVFKCSYCSYETYLRSNLAVHVNAKHTKKTFFKCSYCSYETYLRNNFNRHVKVKHTKDTVFNCSYCAYETYLQRNLDVHVNAKHAKNIRFKCTYCEYETYLRNNLDVHVNAKHTRSTVFKCSHCSYESYVQTNFTKHVKSKHGSSTNYVSERQLSF